MKDALGKVVNHMVLLSINQLVETSVAVCDFSTLTLKNELLYVKFIMCLFFFLNIPLMATTNSDNVTRKGDVISNLYAMNGVFVL